MSIEAKQLSELINELPPDAQMQIRDFAEYLLTKYERKEGKKLRQNWAGALSSYQQQFTSLSLQEKSLEWRNEV